MKEKTIEKIPYLGLQKISRKKSVKYIGVTAVKIIGHKKHLLLEVYENKKESKKIPVVGAHIKIRGRHHINRKDKQSSARAQETPGSTE